ncbi:MAG: signal peptidase II [Planctomycetota bacterium]
MSATKRHLCFGIALIFLMIGDLWSKSVVFELVSKQPSPRSGPYDLYKNPPYRGPYYPILTTNPGLQFFASYNKGVTFGMFGEYNLKYFFILFCLVAFGVLVKLYLEKEPRLVLTKAIFPFRIALLLVASGALGNMTDRFFYVGVRDFISVYLVYNQERYHYPTFNVADSYIVTGIIILVLLNLFCAKPQVKESVK